MLTLWQWWRGLYSDHNTDENNIVKLIGLANKYKTQIQLQRQRAYDYYLKVEDTSD